MNQELVGLGPALEDATRLLVPSARAVVISFHSLEDRIVKQTWRRLEAEGSVQVLTKRPITPGATELSANPRSRSAKFRAVERQPAAREAA